jgi:hypothetical protein
LAEDLLRLLALPDEAKTELWTVLGPSLQDELGQAVEALLSAYCERFDIDEHHLALAFKAARFLLRAAASQALSAELFAADLRHLVGDDQAEPMTALLMPRYDEALTALRFENVRAALLDHGRLLLGVDWRVDTIAASQRGVRLDARIAMLTVRFRDGDHNERITLQALPDTLRELRRTLDQILDEI